MGFDRYRDERVYRITERYLGRTVWTEFYVEHFGLRLKETRGGLGIGGPAESTDTLDTLAQARGGEERAIVMYQ